MPTEKAGLGTSVIPYLLPQVALQGVPEGLGSSVLFSP